MKRVLVAGMVCFLGICFGGIAEGQSSVAGAKLSTPQVFEFAKMPARKLANGGTSWDSVQGTLATGEAVSVHESVLPVGSAPNLQHAIQHSEIVTVMEGTLEFERGDKAERVDAGGVIYIAFGTMHTVKNIGNVPAKYVVVAIGGDVKK